MLSESDILERAIAYAHEHDLADKPNICTAAVIFGALHDRINNAEELAKAAELYAKCVPLVIAQLKETN